MPESITACCKCDVPIPDGDVCVKLGPGEILCESCLLPEGE